MMKNLFLSLTFIVLNVFSLSTFSQAGAIDLSFNTTDLGFGFGDGADDMIRGSVTQPDGKIILVGHFLQYNSQPKGRIVRINADGSIDNSFNIGTGANGFIYSVALQPDGKILIGGQFASFNGVTRYRIARLNSDGSVDEDFQPGAGPNNTVLSISLQADGKIIIGGQFNQYNNVTRPFIARLNTDGTYDSSFNAGTGASNHVFTTSIQPDGKIIIGGLFSSFNGTAANRIARLNEDGSIDASFNIGSGANGNIFTTVIQENGKILLGGSFTTFNGESRIKLVRLNEDGSTDNSFDTGTGANGDIRSIDVDLNGAIIAGGSFSTFNSQPLVRIVRLNSDGSIDPNFGLVSGPNFDVLWVSFQPYGKALIGGLFSSLGGLSQNRVSQLNADGSLDSNFNFGSGSNGSVLCSAVQSDGKIIAGGFFTRFNGVAMNRIVRLNSDGTLDTSFTIGSGFDNSINAIEVQQDGKIVIGGTFSTYNGTSANRIIRLNADGTMDETFITGTGINQVVSTLKIQNDGKILLGGNFTTFNGTARNRLVRLNADGSLDTSFNIGSGFNNTVFSIGLTSDNKVVVAGAFTTINGTSRNYVARLNSNGGVDTSFNPGTGPNSFIFTLAIDADQKIVVGGNFYTFNGISQNRLARLNTNGSLDNSFNIGTGFNSQIRTLCMTADGRIIAGGIFTTFNGNTRPRIIAINTDGSEDISFEIGSGASSDVLSIVAHPDDKLIIGGSFTSYNGTGRNRIARIYGSCEYATTPVISSSSIENCGAQLTTLSIASGDLNDATDWQWYAGSCGGTPVGSGTSIDITPTATATYFARGEGGCVVNATCGEIEISVLQDCGTPLVANDYFGDASSITVPSFPFCSNRFLDLTNATPSPQASTTAPEGAGQDVWYAFIAQTNGARITSTSVACDVVIELHDATNAVIGVENETTSGTEVLVANNLTPGTTYYVLVRNFNPTSVGTVTTCIQNMAASAPDNGTTFNNLCSFIKCDWNGAQLYSVTFDDGTNQYTASSTSTQIPFSLLTGIQYGTTYDVTFATTFIQNDAAGNPTTTVVTSAPYTVTIEEHLEVALRATDRCPQTRSIGSFIGTDRVLCGVIGYEWEFTLSDEFGAPLALDPIIVSIIANSRYIRTTTISGIQPGDYYMVRVRPLFSYGAGVYGDAYLLCIAGNAGIPIEGGNATPSLESVVAERSVKLYPNPNNGEMINIQLTGITSETVQVNVIDALGRVITTKQYSVNKTFSGTILFDTKLSSGIYNVQIVDGEKVMMERVVVR